MENFGDGDMFWGIFFGEDDADADMELDDLTSPPSKGIFMAISLSDILRTIFLQGYFRSQSHISRSSARPWIPYTTSTPRHILLPRAVAPSDFSGRGTATMAGDDLRSLVLVSATVTAAMCYVRFAARRLRPGFPRLAAFLPVLAVLPFLPLAFRAIHPRAISGFFLGWLAEFKLLLLANGQGPLHPSLPLSTFVAVSSGPVRLRANKPAQGSPSGLGLVPSAVMAALLAVIVSLYRYEKQMNQYLLLTLYTFHMYLAMELILASAAAACRALLGLDLEPQFDRPYLSESLRDFWGRRWNLSMTAVLRPCVYHPVRAWLGSAPAGVLATFLVSGVVHELMFSYITLRPPTGEATAFFALHGACAVAEAWWARHDKWWRPPRLAATPLVLAFLVVTAFWLFFPPITRPRVDKVVIAECVAFLREAVAWAAGPVRSVWTGRS